MLDGQYQRANLDLYRLGVDQFPTLCDGGIATHKHESSEAALKYVLLGCNVFCHSNCMVLPYLCSDRYTPNLQGYREVL